jgi:ADP-heptose:LPS heptosyltransferase
MRSFTERIKWLGSSVLDSLFSRDRGREQVGTSPKRILILQLQQIGDSVIFTPALRALRTRFSDSDIHLLASPVAAQFYKKSPHVDQIHVATSWTPSEKRIAPLLPLLRQLRTEQFDCVITDIAHQSFKYSIIAFLIRAPLRVGFNLNHRGFLHTCQVVFRPAANWVECNLDLVRVFGPVTSGSREEVAFDDADVARVTQLLQSAGHEERRRLVVLHTGSNWQSRTWFSDRWARLADTLRETCDADIVFVGGAGEKEYVEGIRERMTGASISFVGLTDIPELAALASRLDLFVGTDSGPRHVTGAVGAPHVTLMCAQDDTDRWFGFRPGETVMRSEPACQGCYFSRCAHKVCMDAIEFDRVLELCDSVLSHGDARTAPPALDRVPMPARLQPFVAARTCDELRAAAKEPVGRL